MKKIIVGITLLLLIADIIFFTLGTTSSHNVNANIGSTSYPIKGIDVSHWQGNINWSSVHSSNIVFAFVKATQGTSYVDSNFEENMKNGHAAGIYMSAYHFADPQDYNAKDSAKHFVDVIKPYLKDGYMRPVLDLEEGSSLGKQTLSDWVNKFMVEVYNLTGIKPIIYTNTNYAENYLDSSVEQWNLWIANYDVSSPNTGIWDSWAFWQYTDKGQVPGVSGNVDLDYYNGNLDSFLDNFVIHPTSKLKYYSRDAAIGYAHIWYNSYNKHYDSFDNSSEESTNFVSQALIAGGLSLWKGYNGNGDGAMNYNGSIINPYYLSQNLIKYQNSKYSYYTSFNSTIPSWLEIGDVVICGDNTNHYIFSGLIVFKNSKEVYIASHSPNQWNTSISNYFPSKYSIINFYHIPDGCKNYLQVFKITADALHIRVGPGTQYQIIATSTSNQEFVAYNYTYDSSGQKWWQFFYDDRVGWCSAKYTSISYSDILVVNVTSSLHIRVGPGTSYDILGHAYNGMLFAKKGQEYNGDEDITWYEIFWGSSTGWFAADYVNYVPEINYPSFIIISIIFALFLGKKLMR